MALVSSFFNCFTSSGQVCDYAEGSKLKSASSEKPKTKPKSKGAPIVVSYFPVNHYPSRFFNDGLTKICGKHTAVRNVSNSAAKFYGTDHSYVVNSLQLFAKSSSNVRFCHAIHSYVQINHSYLWSYILLAPEVVIEIFQIADTTLATSPASIGISCNAP
ncbi:hypothetical protein VNO78_13092 [Psophocarpus tetragonolobus]|uniref:Uncharacterized protein n=1 Tax=Psophocarpus tetragonolobus TaxID=3891 RepID=A0AAN9SNU9_PSOTE